MDDWRLSLTREEHEHASIEQLKKSLAASRALVEELKTHIKMEGHGETVGITHEEGCHMCHALALTEKP